MSTLSDNGSVMHPKQYHGETKNHIVHPMKRQMFKLKDRGAKTFLLEHELLAWCPLIQVMDISTNSVVWPDKVRVIRQGLLEISLGAPIPAPKRADEGHDLPYGYSVTLIG